MPKKIFEYKYEVCWWPKSIITVLDTKKENIIIERYPSFISEPTIYKLNLQDNKREELKNIIEKHKEVFSLWEIEHNWVCDWCSSEFLISDWKNTIELSCFNMWYFDHDESHKQLWKIKEKVDGQEVINVKILLEFFYEVKDFLLKAWVPNACLKY